MKKNISLFIKGVVLGIAFIIPGVSGGTLAVLLQIYEELIEAVTCFYKSLANLKKYFMFLLPIGLGALTSLLLCAKLIEYGLSKAPTITILIFLGLIIGGIPKLFKTVDKKPEFKDFSLMLIGIIIVLGMMIIDKSSTNVNLHNINIWGYIVLFLVGTLASATMVVPGISGSFTLMLIGYYEPVLEVVNEISSFNNLGTNIIIMIPFMLGVVIGIFLIAKIINYLLNKYRTSTYYVIIGFVLASIMSVFIEVLKYDMNIVHLIIGLILMSVNSYLVYKVFDR